MPRKCSPPKMCRNKMKNFAFVIVNRKQIYLGPWGSEKAEAAYKRFLIEWAQQQQNSEAAAAVALKPKEEKTLSELLQSYVLEYSSRKNYNYADYCSFIQISKRLTELFPNLNANQFGLPQMEVFRDSFEQSGFERRGVHKEYTRTYLNKLVKKVRTIFSWGVSKGMVDVTTRTTLDYFRPLRIGQTSAPEPKPRQIVNDSDFEAVVQFLLPIYQDFVRVLRLTGMRPSELCNMRICDLDKEQYPGIWIYTPEKHKTQAIGKLRHVALGAKVQSILLKYVEGKESEEYLFTPKQAMLEYWELKRNLRKTAVQPSQVKRGEAAAERKFDRLMEKLDPHSLGNALRWAFNKADKTGVKYGRRWTLYELRHTRITEVRMKYGAETAQHVAGHSTLNTQAFYDHSAIETIVTTAKVEG